METGSQLAAHIDKMIKTCHERLSGNMSLGASADFVVGTALSAIGSGIVIGADQVRMLARSMTDASNALALATQELTIYPEKPLGTLSNAVEVDAELIGSLKYALERAENPVIVGAQVDSVGATSFLASENAIVVNADIVELCYQVYNTVETSLNLACSVLDTELQGSVGRMNNGVDLDVAVTGEHSDKFDAFQNAVQILSGVTETLILFIHPVDAFVTSLDAEVTQTAITRYRKLSELDGLSLSDLDDMTLGELDYVTLE